LRANDHLTGAGPWSAAAGAGARNPSAATSLSAHSLDERLGRGLCVVDGADSACAEVVEPCQTPWASIAERSAAHDLSGGDGPNPGIIAASGLSVSTGMASA